MKLSFSTLACPDRTMPEIVQMASAYGYNGIELRFVQGEDSLWKLSAFSGNGLASTVRTLSDHSLAISCLDTSCRFHSPDAAERRRWLVEGDRMSDLAAMLGAPAVRVFGDTIQPGADRGSTRKWIEEGIQELAENTASKNVQVWIENHGDFVSATETRAVLAETSSPQLGVVWDPANSFVATQERPSEGAAILGALIRHVHIKDVRQNEQSWKYVLSGEGDFPLSELKTALETLHFDQFLSFEWEKKWHPEIVDAEIALPHFVSWFRKNVAHA